VDARRAPSDQDLTVGQSHGGHVDWRSQQPVYNSNSTVVDRKRVAIVAFTAGAGFMTQGAGALQAPPPAPLHSGVATGWTGVDPTFARGRSLIDTNPTSFYKGRGGGVGPVKDRTSDPRYRLAIRARHVCPPHIF